MKKLIYITIIFTVSLVPSGCEDVLTTIPGDSMTDENFFGKASDFQSYVNGLYDGVDRNIMRERWANLENGSDNLIANTPAASLMRHGVSGEAPLTSGQWNGAYDYLRRVNYVLDNAHKSDPVDLSAQHYIGEAYFFRAHIYFVLLQAFGGVPFVDKVLSTDDGDLFKTRESRDVIAERIIEDLDNAISRLFWKGEGAAVSGRINKQTALLYKTRVGLFEGSWEYYHGSKGTPFGVAGKDGSWFLDQAIDAGDVLMERQGAMIFVGPPGFEYENLFNRTDYNSISSAFFYRDNEADLGVTFDFRDTPFGWGVSPTKSAIDSYLMSDGKPEELSSVVYDLADQSSLLRARDPRLVQTVYPPDRGGYKDLFGGLSVEQFWNVQYPDLNHSYIPNPGGYRIIKGTPLTTISLFINETDDLIMRYEEALLNYVEAKAIKGTVTQQDIDNTVNVVRGRVGMVPMNLAEVNGWALAYSEENGYDPDAPNVLNEIRRERRVELMFEGFRTMDIRRWALLAEVFNGQKPKGAYFQEIFDYWNDVDILLAAGMPQTMIDERALVEGVNVDRVGDYIRPFWRNADFTDAGRGYYIDPERDYLQAIPKGEINFYREKAGVTLTQNPGWF